MSRRMSNRPVSRPEFIKYVLRQLSAGVNDIELTEDQLEDVVNDVISDFQEYHRDGARDRLLYLRRQQGQTRWELPPDVLAVNRVLQGRFSYFFHGGVSDVHLMFSNHGTAMFGSGTPDGQTLTAYYIMEQHYQEIRQQLIANPSFDFNFIEGVLELRSPLPPGGSTHQEMSDHLMVEVVSAIDETTNPGIYSHKWVREYAVAKAGLLWSLGLMKFDSSFSDGSKVNANSLYLHYKSEVDRLKVEAEESDMIAEPFIW